jgi:hypothetical protein
VRIRLSRFNGGWKWQAAYRGRTRTGWAETRGRAIGARLVAMYELREAVRPSGWEGAL